MSIIIPNMGMKKIPPVGLSGALFSKTQQRVLALLFGNPDRSFFANEIMRLAQSGTGAVARELAALESAGLATVTRIGNQKHYQANRTSPIFEELRGIVAKTFGVADVLRASLAPLAVRIKIAFVYGSVANGSDTAKSDIDLMVIGDDIDYSALFSVTSQAGQQLGRKVNPTIYSSIDIRTKIAEGNAFAVRVLDRPKIFLMGTENDLPKPRKSRKGKAAQA